RSSALPLLARMRIHHHPPMATPRLHMVTPLRFMGMRILITGRGTIPATDTVVIMVEGAMVTVDIGIGSSQTMVT
ncbi:MAG TPA: hypothetical protein VLX12_08220, partial [Syntrophorhabdales bacterium]|nr:hypothetical protein [Syntrophorhabdales bacterium]